MAVASPARTTRRTSWRRRAFSAVVISTRRCHASRSAWLARTFAANGRPGRPLPANVRANKALRDAWQQRVSTTTAENARRRRDVRVVVRANEPTAIQPRGP